MNETLREKIAEKVKEWRDAHKERMRNPPRGNFETGRDSQLIECIHGLESLLAASDTPRVTPEQMRRVFNEQFETAMVDTGGDWRGSMRCALNSSCALLASTAPATPLMSEEQVREWDLEDLRGKIFDRLAEKRRDIASECDGEELAEDVEAWSTRDQFDIEQYTGAMMEVFVPEIASHLLASAAPTPPAPSEPSAAEEDLVASWIQRAALYGERAFNICADELAAWLPDHDARMRGAALEEAAKICERKVIPEVGLTDGEIRARMIRALRGKVQP